MRFIFLIAAGAPFIAIHTISYATEVPKKDVSSCEVFLSNDVLIITKVKDLPYEMPLLLTGLKVHVFFAEAFLKRHKPLVAEQIVVFSLKSGHPP